MEKGLTVWQLLAFIIIALMAATLPLLAEEVQKTGGAKAPGQAELLAKPGVSGSLVDACELVRLLNEGKLNAVKARCEKHGMMIVIETQSKMEGWPGIGAYRGSEWDEEENTVRHRFAYGAGKDVVHELWLTYPIADNAFKKPSLGVLGW